MCRVLLSGGLSALKDGSDDHDIPGFQGIILREIDDYLLSLRQQIQHDVVIIRMVLGTQMPATLSNIRAGRANQWPPGNL